MVSVAAIWYYALPPVTFDIAAFDIPAGAKFLTVATTGRGERALYFQVDPTNRAEQRRFVVAATGQQFDPEGKVYLGTYNEGPYVWHVFEIKDGQNG